MQSAAMSSEERVESFDMGSLLVDPITTKPGSRTSLLKLPNEIRSLIWHKVLVLSPQPVVMRRFSSSARNHSVMRLLEVCRSIHAEAYHIFHASNTLYMSSPAMLFRFLEDLSPRRRENITSISVGGFGLHYTGVQVAAKAFGMLQLCSNLQDFRLELPEDIQWTRFGMQPSDTIIGDWNAWCEALEVLGNSLRGLTSASISGLETDHEGFVVEPEKRVEVDCEQAHLLKKSWLRPRSSRRRVNGSVSGSRVKRAISNLRMSRKWVNRPRPGLFNTSESASGEHDLFQQYETRAGNDRMKYDDSFVEDTQMHDVD